MSPEKINQIVKKIESIETSETDPQEVHYSADEILLEALDAAGLHQISDAYRNLRSNAEFYYS